MGEHLGYGLRSPALVSFAAPSRSGQISAHAVQPCSNSWSRAPRWLFRSYDQRYQITDPGLLGTRDAAGQVTAVTAPLPLGHTFIIEFLPATG